MASQYPHHESLRLQNFTVFSDVEFSFSPGVNIFVGENGTGKTHVLKILYAGQLSGYRGLESTDVREVFQKSPASSLIRDSQKEDGNAYIQGHWHGGQWKFKVHEWFDRSISTLLFSRPVFIPAVDMMAHTRRFVSTYDEYQIDFDYTYRDIVSLLLSPEKRNGTPNELIGKLSSVLGGEVEEESERFYLKTENGRYPMPLVAEGLRKIATLQQLIKNGFLQPGSVLFWDEPEVNLNPKLMDEVVDALLTLARSGVQVFLATHSYVILKEFDLQATPEDKVRYFGFAPNPDGVTVKATDDYSLLDPNPIAEQFDRLYDLELKRSLRTGR